MDAADIARALASPSGGGSALFAAVRDSLLGPEAAAALRARRRKRRSDAEAEGDDAPSNAATAAPARTKKPQQQQKQNPVGRNYKPTLVALSNAVLEACSSDEDGQQAPLLVLVDALSAAVDQGAGMSAGASSSSSGEEEDDNDNDDNATTTTTTPPSLAAVVAHVLAEAVPPPSALGPGAALATAQPRASALLSRLVSAPAGAHGAKLAAKVAASFALAEGDVEPTAWRRLQVLVPALMRDRAHQAAAVRLLVQFPRLAGEVEGPLAPADDDDDGEGEGASLANTTTTDDDPNSRTNINIDAALAFLVDEGQEALAERWAASLPRDRRAAFVRACVATDRLKAAARAVQAFGLQAEFPSAERAYRERSVARMAERRLWPVALGFVRGDRGLQRQLLGAMAASGEAQLAATYADQLGFFRAGAGEAGGDEDDDEPEQQQADAALLAALRMDPEALAAAEAQRRAAHLQLLPRTRLVLVDTAESLERAAEALASAPIVAIDVEWRPGGVLLGSAVAASSVPAQDEENGNGGSGSSSGGSGADDEEDGEGEEQGAQEVTRGRSAQEEGAPAARRSSRSRSRSRRRRRRRRNGGGAAAASGSAPAAMKEQAALLQVAVWGLPPRAQGSDDDADDNQACANGDVFLFDLPALATARPAALDACLSAPFAHDALVLGFEAAGDLAKLASSWPQVAAFRRVRRVLDVRALWAAYVTSLLARGGGGLPLPSSNSSSTSGSEDQGGEDESGADSGTPAPPPPTLPLSSSSASLRALTTAGLSTLSRTLLGLPLDKSMQLSDWAARPLTKRQVEYAANDAQVLPRLRARLRQELGVEAADAVERRAEFSFVAGGGGGGGGGAGGGGGSGVTATVAAAAAALPASAAPTPLLELLEQHGLGHCARRHRDHHQPPLPAPVHSGGADGGPSHPPLEGKAVALLAGNGGGGGAASARPVVAVARAEDRIDLRKLARHLQLPRRLVRVASRRECLEVLGYAPGTLPPVGHGPRTTLVVDFRLGNASLGRPREKAGEEAAAAPPPPPPPPEIVFGAGDDRLELGLTFDQLLRLLGGRDAVVADVAEVVVAAGGGGGGAPPPSTSPPAPTAPPLVPAPTAPTPPSTLQPLASAPKFLVDSMCGRLARWLRCLGLDAESLDVATDRLLREAADAAIAEVPTCASSSSSPAASASLLAAARAASTAAESAAAAAPGATPARKASPSVELIAAQRRRDLRLLVADHHARSEGRVLLTRDAQLATSREGLSLGAFLLASDETVAQLAELAAHFGRELLESRLGSDAMLTRCSSCNRAEYEPLSREDAKGLVPPRAWAAVDEFWRCGFCERIVWWGPKSDRAVADTRERVAQALAMLDARRQGAREAAGATTTG